MLTLLSLDVLAVWHALMLNPRDYIAYCKKHGLDRLILAPFHWDRIVRSPAPDTRWP